MQLPWPMATLTTDRMAQENRIPIAIDRPLDGQGTVGVAVKAGRLNRPVETSVRRLIARRQIPLVGAGIPGDRGLKQKTLSFNEIGETESARTDDVLDLPLMLCDHAPDGVPAGLAMKQVPIAFSIKYSRPCAAKTGRPPVGSRSVDGADAIGASDAPIGCLR